VLINLNGTGGRIARCVRSCVSRVGTMRFDNAEAAAACRLYAAEYQAKAKNALLPSERESFAGIAERFETMAGALEMLQPVNVFEIPRAPRPPFN
jgi:hypothetical protein